MVFRWIEALVKLIYRIIKFIVVGSLKWIYSNITRLYINNKSEWKEFRRCSRIRNRLKGGNSGEIL